jgi:hypothetical protein
MFQSQVQRVTDNILPFASIGLLIGFTIGKASWFRSFDSVNGYFNYAVLDTHYPDSGQSLFFDHFNPDTLTLLLVAIFALAAISRLFFGVRENFPEEGKGNIRALENFGSLLAIAWLGLILGISLPTLLFQGFASFTKFIVYIAYPLIFLIEVKICTAFLSGKALYKVHELAGGYKNNSLGVRAEGLLLMILTILMLTFHDRQTDAIRSFTHWVRSML